jgi:drug/metabolite transporter (DMT)-like permease
MRRKIILSAVGVSKGDFSPPGGNLGYLWKHAAILGVFGTAVPMVTIVSSLQYLSAGLAGTFSGMLLSFYNIKRFGATAGAMSEYVIPIVAASGGVLILGEHVTLGMLTGMVLIAGGITLINQRKQFLAMKRRASLPGGK